jgi:hypothetical protein
MSWPSAAFRCGFMNESPFGEERPGAFQFRVRPAMAGGRFLGSTASDSFPGFYKHVTDTMRRIPYGANGNTFDNLTVATRILLARSNQAEITWLARCPTSLDDFRVFLQELFTPLGVPADELSYFIDRLLIVATSCPERRFAEFENIAWWDFIAAPKMSRAYQAYLAVLSQE